LVETFADQAVIAIENTRLFEAEQASKRELQESLEYQTAAAEVLDVISRSPTNSQPVLDTIAASVCRLTGTERSAVFLFDGQQIHLATQVGLDDAAAQVIAQSYPQVPDRGSATARAIRTRQVVYVPDVLADSEYRKQVDVAKAVGYRSIVSVPMLRDDHPVGAITTTAASPAEFTQRQIALLQTFANQAVIAINNAGLFEEVQARTRELTESLEQQTATADVLKVISRSALDVQRVLDALVESAARLCDAYDAVILQVAGDDILRVVGHHGPIPPAETLSLTRGIATGRAVLDRRIIQVADLQAETDEYPEGSESARRLGFRTILNVPLICAGEAIGAISLRRIEARPFTNRQIELVTTFAAQAVIAIENTRLLNELRESLQQQTATSEILRAISGSPGDLGPVFKAILENATRICGTKLANLALHEGGIFRTVAMAEPSLYPDWWRQNPIDVRHLPDAPLGRLIATKSVVHIADLTLDQAYLEGHRHLRAFVDHAGARTYLIVPMLKERDLVGAIAIYRQEVRPFTEKQIDLVKSFASQAVIAIENTRLFESEQASKRELQEALEQQTATADVLKSSAGRRSICKGCSMRWSSPRRGCAMRMTR
jgi:GAF domain-containing protein